MKLPQIEARLDSSLVLARPLSRPGGREGGRENDRKNDRKNEKTRARARTSVLDTEVVTVFQESGKPRLDPTHPHAAMLEEMMKSGDFSGKFGAFQFVRFGGMRGALQGASVGIPQEAEPRSRNLLFVGLGSSAEFSEERARSLGGHVFSRLQGEKVDECRLSAEPFSAWTLGMVRAFAEGLMLAGYHFGKYKSRPQPPVDKGKRKKHSETDGPGLHLVCETRSESLRKNLDLLLEETRLTVEAVWLARDLSNEPSNIAHPEFIAGQARELARRYGLKFRVVGEAEARKLGMELFLAVGQGSHRESCVVVLEYAPRGVKKPRTLALVGKGVTFDSGGISLKPALRMEEMKHDMSGAAAVLATLVLAARLKVKSRIVGFLALTENMPGGIAIQPGNVIRARNGKTVEIVNTDAEGRLILADVLDFAHEWKPDAIVDIATLTGAVSTALGKHCAAILGNDQALVDRVKSAAVGTGEKLWQLPLWDEYLEDLRSDTADFKNTGNDPLGGTIRAAAFMKQFIQKDMPWAHLDIAAMANGVPHYSYIPKRGATGLYVRTLARLAREF